MTTARIHATEPLDGGYYPYLIVRYAEESVYAITFESLNMQELHDVELRLDSADVARILEGKQFQTKQPPIEFRCCGDAEKLTIQIKFEARAEELELSFWMSELALAWNLFCSA